MKSFVLISVLCLHSAWSFAVPDSTGVGAFAYQDSAGTRYGGTYRLRDGQVVDTKGDFPPNFQYNTFQDLDNFFPEYFRNLGNLLQEAFDANFESQRLAFNAAQKAFDLTSNQAGYIPNFNYRYPGLNNFPDFGGFSAEPLPITFPTIPNLGNDFSAFAAAVASPGYNQQIAAINPQNPVIPNVNTVNQYAVPQTPNNGSYVSVSSSSYSSSSNVDGQIQNSRGAETIVNDNGKVTKYKVQS